jgi:hypothetical protein
LILGVVALVLGGSGLAIALTHAGPAGPTGAAGARGAPGPGATTLQGFNVGTTALSGVCGYYSGSNLTFVVSEPGTFVITASVEIYIHHSSGNYTFYTVSLANTSAACNPEANNFVEEDWSDAFPTGNYYPTHGLAQNFQVGAAGTYTFGIVGTMGGGTDPTEFYYATVVAVFYPS